MSTPTTRAALNYTEREAIKVLRKAMVRKPEIIDELLKGMTKEIATRALLLIRDELDDMLTVTRAFQQAAGTLAKGETP